MGQRRAASHVSRPRWRRFAWRATLMPLLLPACARAPDPALALQQRCVCDYVTDFDAPGHVEVRVCAPASQRESVARSCAVSSGVGAVTSCVCQATPQSCANEPPCKLPSDAPAPAQGESSSE